MDDNLSLTVCFADYSFSGKNSDKTVSKAKFDNVKGGCVIFFIRNENNKPKAKITFKWNKKRLLMVTVKGTPAPDPDPEAGVSNIIDLNNESDGSLSETIKNCDIIFGSAKLALPDIKTVPYTGKKKTKKDLPSWSIKGGIK